jgi:hypothetical protein
VSIASRELEKPFYTRSRCCGDEPWLFLERWEKLFEDFCDVEQKKFDPSRVRVGLIVRMQPPRRSRWTLRFLNSMIPSNTAHFITEHSSLPSLMRPGTQMLRSHQIAGCMSYMVGPKLFLISSPPRNTALTQPRSQHIQDFDQIFPTDSQTPREEIAILTSLPLLQKIVEDLENARNQGGSSVTLYFTKESHIHTLVNLVLLSGLPIANRRIPELDYAVCHHRHLQVTALLITFLYSRMSRKSTCQPFGTRLICSCLGLSCMNAITDVVNLTKSTPSSCPSVRAHTRRMFWTLLLTLDTL